MRIFEELAPAKVNLTLEVFGRRGDGYHELLSLVAFADVGDIVRLDAGGDPGVTTSGPFAGHISGSNILDRALGLVRELAPAVELGRVHLEKRLPVAAGLGGGSANAAALLRALQKSNPEAASDVDWFGLARRLGADVPVCLFGRACWMAGIGHGLMPVERALPQLDVVLVNPLAEVPADKTARVFRALGAGPLEEAVRITMPEFSDRDALVAIMRERGNDLAEPASVAVPATRDVLSALEALEGSELVAVSGAGPTCFGVFPNAAASSDAEVRLRRQHDDWWVTAARIG